ncbi:MAG: class I SAM-dependent rRNA methyltransferase [Bacillota bacterium]|nr:class I SAM-dependent rRNA methyltransferase [Bacillota bacterium]
MAKAYLVKGKEKRVEYGHPWIFKSDIDITEGSFENGDVIDVYSFKKRFLGRGYINLKSQISIRMLTYEHEEINYAFLYKRIQDAWEYRKKVADINSCRAIFAESDFLPALIVDKFGGYLVVQVLSLGMEKFKPMIIDILDDIIKPLGIYERSDVAVRELEGLEQTKGFLKGNFDTNVEMIENGIKFMVDVESGQKTGYFLDQKENRAALRPFVENAKVLDCFTHVGSFALHAGYYKAREVTGIDISEHAVHCASENAKLNGLENTVRFETANTFDKLRECYDNREHFDVVILDPPAFTKTRGAVEGAVRGYKEINLRAMKIISSGGFLVTCSCSHHVDPELFMDIIYNAAIDSKRKVRLIEYRSQAKDHPILIAAEETQYLKCAILQVV